MATASGGQLREEEKPERKKRAELAVLEVKPAKKVGSTTPRRTGSLEKSGTVTEFVDGIVDLALNKGRRSTLNATTLVEEALRHRGEGVPTREQTLVRVKVTGHASAAAVHLRTVFDEAAFAFAAIEQGERKGTKGQIVANLRWG